MKTTFHERLGPKRTSFLRSVGLLLLIFVLAGCPAGKQSPAPGTEGRIVIKGSNTIGEELAPRLIAEYKKEHPAIVFELESKGTAYGFGNLLAGPCDIAAASRVANQTELQLASSRGLELSEHVIGSYCVAVIVNAGSPVENLTRDQVRDIFTGAVQNWKDVGGPDAQIRLYIRDPISGTHLGFRELAMENQPYGPNPNVFTNYAGITQAVAQDANGIGYSSLDLANKAGIKAVSIGGVAPTGAAVKTNQYPYARVLRLYTKKGKETLAVSEFVQFVESARGQVIVEQMGFVPRP